MALKVAPSALMSLNPRTVKRALIQRLRLRVEENLYFHLITHLMSMMFREDIRCLRSHTLYSVHHLLSSTGICSIPYLCAVSSNSVAVRTPSSSTCKTLGSSYSSLMEVACGLME
eukprot:2160812-Amphidinium_carterae.1